MQKEFEAHYKEGNYKLIKKDQLPEGATLLSSVWQMKRKSRSGAKNKRGAIPERGSIGQEQNRIGNQPLSPKNFSKRFPLTKEKPTFVTRPKNFVDIKS